MSGIMKKVGNILCCVLVAIVCTHEIQCVFATDEIQIVHEIGLKDNVWLDVYDNGWNFPISSDDEEWKDLSVKEKRAVCNMPTELLQSLSTEEVVQLALKYPLLIDIGIYNSYL